MRNFTTFFLLIVLASCASRPYHYPLDKKFNKDEPITLQATIDLAYASYLSACVDIFHLGGQENVYEDCKLRASQYIEDNVIDILEQDGTGD